MLDIEIFTYLNKAFEFNIVFVVVLVFNRGMIIVCGIEDVILLYGVLFDLIDRLLIVRILLYDKDEIRIIIERRVIVERL